MTATFGWSTKTGRYVTKEYARKHPKRTVKRVQTNDRAAGAA